MVIELGIVLQLALLIAIKLLSQRRRDHGFMDTLFQLQLPARQVAIQRPADGRKFLEENR
ncbi:hypothetical protein D3C81_837950 [compost metagenome]